MRKNMMNMKIQKILIIAIFGIIFLFLIGFFCVQPAFAWVFGWDYRKPITITDASSPLTNYPVLITTDTASLISAGKMRSDCADIRFTDSDETSLIDYWLESGCNTDSTKIWVEVPSIPVSGRTIYMYYGNPGASSASLTWSGNFILMFQACPVGWSQFSALDNKFPRGSATYGGTGGSATHAHTFSGTTDECHSGGASGGLGTGFETGFTIADHDHKHDYSGVTSSASSLPPYLEMIFCNVSSIPGFLPSDTIAIFDDSSLPAEWSRFSTIDGKFPRGSATYGGTGGSATHAHTFSGTTGPAINFLPIDPALCPPYSEEMKDYQWLRPNPSSGSIYATDDHTHDYSFTTSSANSWPPYLSVLFANTIATTSLPVGMIAIFDNLPPMGWSEFSAIKNRLPIGGATYGGIGGSSNHRHSFNAITTGPSDIIGVEHSGGGYAEYTKSDHHHIFQLGMSPTTSSASSLPPYLDVIFAKRHSPEVSVNVGEEEIMDCSDHDETQYYDLYSCCNDSSVCICQDWEYWEGYYDKDKDSCDTYLADWGTDVQNCTDHCHDGVQNCDELEIDCSGEDGDCCTCDGQSCLTGDECCSGSCALGLCMLLEDPEIHFADNASGPVTLVVGSQSVLAMKVKNNLPVKDTIRLQLLGSTDPKIVYWSKFSNNDKSIDIEIAPDEEIAIPISIFAGQVGVYELKIFAESLSSNSLTAHGSRIIYITSDDDSGLFSRSPGLSWLYLMITVLAGLAIYHHKTQKPTMP